MFTPEILSMPVFSALDGGVMALPSVGAVLAWMLIAAFVGSALGLLREALRGTERTPVATKGAAEVRVAPTPRAHECYEAV